MFSFPFSARMLHEAGELFQMQLNYGLVISETFGVIFLLVAV